MQVHHHLACRLECTMLPGNGVAQIVSSKIDAPGRLQQACIRGAGPTTGPRWPVDPGALAETRLAPVVGEGGLTLLAVGLAMVLASLLHGVLLTLVRRQYTKEVGGLGVVLIAHHAAACSQQPLDTIDR